MNSDPNIDHVQSRAVRYVQAIADIFYDVCDRQDPLDRVLKRYFKENTQCGSRDRLFIREALYSLFRWYGWLKGRCPNVKPEAPLTSKPFCQTLSAAMWLDQAPICDVTRLFFEAAGVDLDRLGDSPAAIDQKRKGLAYAFEIRKVHMHDLVPEWAISSLPSEADADAWVAACQQRPPVWLRLQNKADIEKVRRELEACGVESHVHPQMLVALKLLNTRFNIRTLESYKSGYIEIQDLASQTLGAACRAQKAETWWDVCAGGGGKSLLLADCVGVDGSVVSTDKREWILKELMKRSRRAHFDHIKIEGLHDVMFSEMCFDGVLVDAPCSSSGTWRRNPDARWIMDERTVNSFPQTQASILNSACERVRAGGVLMYATCSVSVHENEEVVEKFLNEHTDFCLEPFQHPLNMQMTDGRMRIDSFPDDCDAMFAARMRRA